MLKSDCCYFSFKLKRRFRFTIVEMCVTIELILPMLPRILTNQPLTRSGCLSGKKAINQCHDLSFSGSSNRGLRSRNECVPVRPGSLAEPLQALLQGWAQQGQQLYEQHRRVAQRSGRSGKLDRSLQFIHEVPRWNNLVK